MPKDFDSMTVKELRAEATRLKIPGRSSLTTKKALVGAVVLHSIAKFNRRAMTAAKKSKSPAKKAAVKKSPAKKSKSPAKKASPAKKSKSPAKKPAAKKSPVKKPAAKKSPAKPRTCSKQTGAKYETRNSPSYPANECCGETMTGNDGAMYKSVRSANGVCRWKKL